MVTYVNSPTERTNGGGTETSRAGRRRFASSPFTDVYFMRLLFLLEAKSFSLLMKLRPEAWCMCGFAAGCVCNHHTCCSNDCSFYTGQSKIFRLLGLGFWLLCLMQLTLNLLLWRRSQGLFFKSDNSSSCTFTWDDVRALTLERDRLAEEKNQLIHTNEQLLHENARLASERSSLQNHNNQLSERNRMLNEQVTKQQRHIQRLQTTITASKDQQDEEKNQLLHKNEQLRNEKDQLASAKDLLHQENQQLKAEKTKLQEANARLTEDIRKLNERLTEREVTPQNLFPLTCPVGWWRHMSSCYQLSSQEGTWENAKLSCETQGAHLVILNHPEEEKAVRAFGRCFAVWIGLKCESFTWTWVDGSFLSETYRNHLHHCYYPYSCVYLQDVPPSNAWFSGTCQLHFRWICELEL